MSSEMLLPLLVIVCWTSRIGSIVIEAGSLRTQSPDEPLGIDVPLPVLTWRLHNSSGVRRVRQVARQIRAANNLEDLFANPLWDTGKILSDSTTIVWEGTSLQSRERIFWQVQLWDSDGNVSGWSDIASFEMPLLNIIDWDPAI